MFVPPFSAVVGFAADVAVDVMKNLTMKGYTVKRIYERSSKEFMPRRNAFVALNVVMLRGSRRRCSSRASSDALSVGLRKG